MILWVNPRFLRNFFLLSKNFLWRNHLLKKTKFGRFFHFFKHGGFSKKNSNDLEILWEDVEWSDVHFAIVNNSRVKHFLTYPKKCRGKNAILGIFQKIHDFSHVAVKVGGFCETFLKNSETCWNCSFDDLLQIPTKIFKN